MNIGYRPQGVCCQQMEIEVSDDHKILSANFYGGCNGNLQGIARLIRGMSVDEVIEKLSGVSCGGKPTSCPDQLSRCLMEYKKYIENQKKEQ